jgi:hypothetical protein
MLEEEEEEAGCFLDRGANKRVHMHHPYVISSLFRLDEVLYNPQRVIHIFIKRFELFS